MHTSYLITIIIGAAASTALFSVLLKRRRMNEFSAGLALILAAALGFFCAKIGYFLLQLDKMNSRYGLEGLLRIPAYQEYSFVCGCAGAVLGVLLTAKLTRQPTGRYLDAFAPCGALMAAVARGAEFFLPDVNLSSEEVELELFQRLPFAVSNEYEEWYFALFFAAAALALAVFVFALIRKKERSVPGLLMERTAFYLSLPLILLESMRNGANCWGFVRVEQVLCAVVLFLLLFFGCLKSKEKNVLRRFAPALIDLCCVGALVFVEFNMDRGYVPLSYFGNYAVMAAVLLIVAGCEIWSSRRRIREAPAG